MSRVMTEAQLRRLCSASAVLLLHLALLAAFIFAMNSRIVGRNPAQEIEVSFPAFIRKPPSPVVLRPDLLAPVMPLQRPTQPELSVPELAPAPASPGSISGVGRALFGCDPSKIDTLPVEERAACPLLPPAKPREQSVRLGPPPDPNSPFAKVIEERFRKATPISRPCPLGGYEDVRGLPCFGFEEGTPPVEGGR
jgi:hypothetical protein